MTEQNSYSDIYSQLMAISHMALENGHYETAYHALTSAMHYVTDLRDEERLKEVETVAKSQQEWIDTHAPEHRMSTKSAVKRQGKSLYDMLARQAATQELIEKHKQHQENTKSKPWLGDV